MANTTQRLIIAGYNTALGMAQESTYGTAVAPTVYLPFTQHNLAVKNALITNMAVRKSAGMPLPGIGTANIGGDVTVLTEINSIGLILGAAFGQGSDVVSGSGTYSHLFSLKGESNSYTLSADDNNGSVSQFVGCKLSQVDFSCKAGGFLETKMTVNGQTDTVLASSSLSPTYSNNPQWLEFAHLAAGASTINGTAVEIADFTLSIKNKLVPAQNSLGGRFVNGMITVQKEISGTMTINYDSTIKDLINTQLWGSASGPAAGSLPTNAGVLTFSLPTSGSLSFSIPAFTISEAPLTRKRGDVLQHQVKFIASELTTGAGNDMQVTLVNLVSTAYA